MAQFLFSFILVITLGVHSSHQAEEGSKDTKPQIADDKIEDNSRYKTLEANATLLKLLVNNKSGVSRSEVFDMLHSRDDHEDHMDLPTFPQDRDDIRPDFTAVPDSQTEYLQARGDLVRKDALLTHTIPVPSAGGEPVGLAAAIMVGVTCSVVCAAYGALIIWRRLDIKRNGLKHELLRNDDNVAETRIEVSVVEPRQL